MVVPDFSRIKWNLDGFSIDDWRFKEHPDDHQGAPAGSDEWFWIFKPRTMIDDYAKMFADRPDFSLSRILELGIWDGGSVAFWALLADPVTIGAVDLNDRGDSQYFRQLSNERSGIRTVWATDQSDEAALTKLLTEHELSPLDLVIDDASHQYRASRRSFELLFPRLRAGGIYCLEDWQWSFEPQSQAGDSPSSTQRPLVELLHDLLGVLASTDGVISKIEIYPLFAVIERGGAPLDDVLDLDALIRRRARPTLGARARQIRGKVGREAARLRRMVRSRTAAWGG